MLNTNKKSFLKFITIRNYFFHRLTVVGEVSLSYFSLKMVYQAITVHSNLPMGTEERCMRLTLSQSVCAQYVCPEQSEPTRFGSIGFAEDSTELGTNVGRLVVVVVVSGFHHTLAVVVGIGGDLGTMWSFKLS